MSWINLVQSLDLIDRGTEKYIMHFWSPKSFLIVLMKLWFFLSEGACLFLNVALPCFHRALI